MMRAACLYDERERPLGKTMVPDSTFVIQHKEAFFFRTQQGVRMPGGGMGAKFIALEPLVRDKLEPM